MMLCSLLEVYLRFGGTSCFHIQNRRANQANSTPCFRLSGCLLGVFFDPEDGENTLLRNVSTHLPDFTLHVPEGKDLLINSCLHTFAFHDSDLSWSESVTAKVEGVAEP
jgi:hypothetical protein